MIHRRPFFEFIFAQEFCKWWASSLSTPNPAPSIGESGEIFLSNILLSGLLTFKRIVIETYDFRPHAGGGGDRSPAPSQATLRRAASMSDGMFDYLFAENSQEVE
jgi:hypothetical protein